MTFIYNKPPVVWFLKNEIVFTVATLFCIFPFFMQDYNKSHKMQHEDFNMKSRVSIAKYCMKLQLLATNSP